MFNIVGELVNVKGMKREDVLFSWDNAHNNGSVQDKAEFRKLGLRRRQLIEISPYSPDMHRVVEHGMHIIKSELDKQFMQHAVVPEARYLQAMVRFIFGQKITQAALQKDVDTLPLAYKVVAGCEGQGVQGPDGRLWQCTEGDWLPHKLT